MLGILALEVLLCVFLLVATVFLRLLMNNVMITILSQTTAALIVPLIPVLLAHDQPHRLLTYVRLYAATV